MAKWQAKAKPNEEPIRSGQVWKSRANREGPSAFLIGDIETVTYPNGDIAERAHGVVITGVDGVNSHERSLDVRSIKPMFPVLAFNPEKERVEEGGQ